MLNVNVFQRAGWLRFACRVAGSPRILVIGGQQSAAVAQAMGFLVPEAAITVMAAAAVTNKSRAAERLLSELNRYDAVFLCANPQVLRDGGAVADLRKHDRVTLVPAISFSAFHPDQVRVGLDGRVPIRGPMGDSHSALVLFGFLSNFSPEKVRKLFQSSVFERLGYFDAWETSVQYLRTLGAETGYDLDASLARWMRRGCFMHSANQIKTYVAVDLARGLLDRVGISFQVCNLEDLLPADPGQQESWPLYPQIAAHYGVVGSDLFLKPALSRNYPRSSMSLKRFIEESFSAYDRLPQYRLVSRQTESWRSDLDLCVDLRRMVENA